MASRTYVAFDTETTGLWAPSHRVVEIGAVRFRLDSESTETFASLINPQRPMPSEVVRIHGITDDMVADAPPIETVLPRFSDFCGDSVLVAHNAPFDISFVGCELDRCELPSGGNLILDTVDIYRRLFPGLPGYSLLHLAQQFKIADTQDHRALADARYVCSLFRQAAARFPAIDGDEALRRAFTVYHMDDWKLKPAVIPESFENLASALEEKRRIRIKYRSAGQPPAWRVIRPVSVHALGDRLYVSAHCEKADADRTFRLDRIEACELLEG